MALSPIKTLLVCVMLVVLGCTSRDAASVDAIAVADGPPTFDASDSHDASARDDAPRSAPEAISLGFKGGFAPRNAPEGGFGGGPCAASRPPVVFVHGNADNASAWLKGSSTGAASVVRAFQDAGYRSCELFAVTWLSPAEQAAPELNYHDVRKASILSSLLEDVLTYTRAEHVDVVGHSMGVTVALHGTDQAGLWSRVRRFVAVAGAVRGLSSCLGVGFANPLATTCGSQNADNRVFGFYPTMNPRMEDGGFRDVPRRASATSFFSIRAGSHDQVVCADGTDCASSAWDAYPNVRAQLDVGVGKPALARGDDSEGVGHFRARSDTAAIQVGMLTTDCTGGGCCEGYTGACER